MEAHMVEPTGSQQIFRIGIEGRLRPHEYLIYGLQHLLALTGIWILPAILGLSLGLNIRVIGSLIQACFITSGLVTILQGSQLLRLPIVQGPDAAFFVAILVAGKIVGLGAAYGSLIVAGLIVLALATPIRGWSLIGFVSRFIAPPIVYGCLLIIIGAQLASIGLPNWLGQPGMPGYPTVNLIIAAATAIAVLIFIIFGGQGMVRRGAILWGIVVGSILYSLVGRISFEAVRNAPVVSLPQLFPFGFSVSASIVALMLVAFIHSTTEAIGMYTLVAEWGGQRLDGRRVSWGIFGEVLGSMVGAAFGGIGTVSYPENVGILRVSRIGSRFVTLTAGVLALLLGMFPKVGVALAVVPGAVLSGATTILFGIICMSGVQMLTRVQWDEMNLAIGGLSFIVAIGTMFLPQDYIRHLSPFWQGVATQPMVVGVILLIVLNLAVNMGLRPAMERRWASGGAPARTAVTESPQP